MGEFITFYTYQDEIDEQDNLIITFILESSSFSKIT